MTVSEVRIDLDAEAIERTPWPAALLGLILLSPVVEREQ